MAEVRPGAVPKVDESGSPAEDVTSASPPPPPPHAPDAGEGRIVIVHRGGASVPLIMLPALLLISAALGVLFYRQGFPHPTETPTILVAAVPTRPDASAKADSSKVLKDPIAPERPRLEVRSMLDPLLIVGQAAVEPSKPPSIGFVPPSEPEVVAAGLVAADAKHETGPDLLPVKPDAKGHAGIESLVPPLDAVESKAEIAEEKGAVVPPKMTRDQILQDIERESIERRAEIRAIEAIKPKLAERDKQVSLERRKEEVAEAQKRANAQRPRFRADLRQVLTGRGLNLGTQVSELREKSLLPVMPEIEDAVVRVLKGSSRRTRFTRNSRIEFMRSKGMSEPDILGILAYDEATKISQRGTARDKSEAWVRAANQLLAVPIATERAAARESAGQ